MFRVLKNGENRIDVEFSGELDSDAMTAALDELVAEAAGIEHGTMLYRIGEFELPTLGAFAVEMSRLPDLIRLTTKFDRIAVVTEEAWIKSASEIEGALIPGLEIRGFAPGEIERAEQWLNE